MKESFYFSHDSNARSDEKMIKLRSRHGAKGYGIFFMLIEMLREAKDYQMLMDFEAIAYEIREDKEVIKDVVENYELFDILLGKQNNFARNFFTSPSLTDRMLARDKIRKKRQVAGKKGGLAKATSLLKQKSSKVLAGKERKGKERKGKKIDSAPSFLTVSEDQLIEVKKVFAGDIELEAEKFINYWNELTQSRNKCRWQTEKTFEVKRRLTAWLDRSNTVDRIGPEFYKKKMNELGDMQFCIKYGAELTGKYVKYLKK